MQGPILEATFNTQQPSDTKNNQNNPMRPSDIPDAQLPGVLLVMMNKYLVLQVASRKQECTLHNTSLTHPTQKAHFKSLALKNEDWRSEVTDYFQTKCSLSPSASQNDPMKSLGDSTSLFQQQERLQKERCGRFYGTIVALVILFEANANTLRLIIRGCNR